MSDSTDDAATPAPVNFTKTPATRAASTGARPGDVTPAAPPLPLTMKLAIGAIILQIVAGLVQALGLRGSTAQLEKALIRSNSKAKNPKSPYTAADIAKDLHTLRNSALLQAIVVGVALVLLIVALRRVRTAGIARWGVIIVAVLSRAPFYVFPITDYPGPAKVAGVVFGVASVASIILLLVPQSLAYFRQCKALAHPDGAPQRPAGLGGLFAPRGIAGQRTPPARSAPAAPPSPAADPTAASRARSKAKVRSDEAAIARGSELARARAKASKSRRTEP